MDQTQNTARPKEKKRSNAWNLAICGVAFVLMIGYLFIGKEGSQIVAALQRFRIEYLFIMLALMLGYWLLEAMCIQILIKKFWSGYPFRYTFTTTMIGQYYNCITPLSSGGQPFQAIYMGRYGMPASASMAVLLIRMIIYAFVTTMYSVVVLAVKLPYFLSLENSTLLIIMALGGFALNAVGIVLFCLLGFWRRGTTKLVHSGISLLSKLRIVKNKEATLKQTDEQLGGAYENMRFILKNPRVVAIVVLLTVVQLTLFYGISYPTYLGFADTPTADAATVISTQSMVSMVAAMWPLPGAIGASESAYVVFFTAVYGNKTLADLSMILWRIMTFYLNIVIGIIVTLLLNRKPKKKNAALDSDK